MNIVIQDGQCAPKFVRNGWVKVFRSMGHQVFMWQKEGYCCFDLFNRIKPIDLLICNTYDADESLLRCLKQNPETKCIMFASAWGPLVDNLDRKEYPIVYVSDAEKKLLEKMKNETGRPDYVFIHITERHLEATMGGWNSIGIRPVGIMNGADVFSYLNGIEKEEYKCDVSYCGGYWPYKAKNIDKYLIPICEFPSRHKIKIFGNSPWPANQYLGQINEEEVKNAFASAVVCPNISEPHSYVFDDLVERIFKVPVANGLLISDPINLSEVFNKNEVPQFSNLSGFDYLIGYYKNPKNAEERLELIKKQKRAILSGHTYFHRCSKMLVELNLREEAQKCLDIYEQKFGQTI